MYITWGPLKIKDNPKENPYVNKSKLTTQTTIDNVEVTSYKHQGNFFQTYVLVFVQYNRIYFSYPIVYSVKNCQIIVYVYTKIDYILITRCYVLFLPDQNEELISDCAFWVVFLGSLSDSYFKCFI